MEVVKLECHCGSLKGELEVTPKKNSFHIHCLCKDCQNFTTYLKVEDRILDEYGGSDLFQTYPSHMKINEGKEKLACIQLKEGGIMRWYTTCCNSPVANIMPSAKMPFIGLSVKMMKFESESESLRVIGPVTMKAFGRSAIGEKPEGAHNSFPKSFMPKMLKFMFIGIIGRRHRNSPFFDNKKTIVQPKVLSS